MCAVVLQFGGGSAVVLGADLGCGHAVVILWVGVKVWVCLGWARSKVGCDCEGGRSRFAVWWRLGGCCRQWLDVEAGVPVSGERGWVPQKRLVSRGAGLWEP